MAGPRIGLLFLGRKRPGFDPNWGGEMKRGVRSLLDEQGWDALIPEDSIPDDPTLRKAISRCRQEGAQTLVVTHVFAANLRQLGKPFELVYGHPGESRTAEELKRAIQLTVTASRLSRAKVGLFGYHAPGFVDLHVDPAALSRLIGAQLYHESVPEFVARVEEVPKEDIAADMVQVRKLGLPMGPITEVDLEVQSRYYLAIRKAMAEERLDALALRCWPDLPGLNGHWPYLALSRLMSQGVAVTMEGDVDGAIATLAGESLGLGPVHYTDWLEHTEHTITAWHTGAVPFQLCQDPGVPGAPALGLQFNDKRPTVVEATLKTGLPATIYRLWRCDDEYRMTALQGEMIEPSRELMATGGLLEMPGTNVPDWFDNAIHQGMPHHISLVHGHSAEQFRRLARLMGWRWV